MPLASLLPPLVHDYDTLIALQFVRGLAVGAFIPAALGFILRSLAPRWWIWGIAAYAFRFVFSQNIAGAIEGWYSETGHWEWIFWQNVRADAGDDAAGRDRDAAPADRPRAAAADRLGGIVYAGSASALIYAGLDQGNRLDWFNSGLVTGLLLAGGLLVVAFCRPRGPRRIPADPSARAGPAHDVAVPALLISIYGFGSTATAFVLPDYLTRVQGLRACRSATRLNWIALPQIVLVPLVALLLRRIDARLSAGVRLRDDRGRQLDRYRADPRLGRRGFPAVSQCVEAVGLAFAITALVTFAIANITPPQAAAIAATIQIARLLGNEIGSAVIQTFVRVREQVYSNLIGLARGRRRRRRPSGRRAQLAGPFGNRATGLGDAAAQGIGLLAAFVRREAYVLAYIDAFWLIAWVSLAGPAVHAAAAPRRRPTR